MFALRFDIDSNFGLTRRLEPLLALLRRFGINATFFCVMGRDASLAEILRLRIFGRGQAAPDGGAMGMPDLRVPPNLPKTLYTLAFPRRVGHGHPHILRELVAAGHEVYPHGWSHIQWQRNLAHIDIRQHLARCIDAHADIFGQAPRGFGSPGRVYNPHALALFDDLGFDFVGDMDGTQPFVPPAQRCLQIPVTLFKTIAEFAAEGADTTTIAASYFQHITSRPFAVIYEYPDNLGSFELDVLRVLFSKRRRRRHCGHHVQCDSRRTCAGNCHAFAMIPAPCTRVGFFLIDPITHLLVGQPVLQCRERAARRRSD